MYKPARLLVWLFFFVILYSGCKKFEKAGLMRTAGVALTFDDDRIDNWYSYLPLLDSANVKATFYICKYHRFSAAQKAKLIALQNHGHEIAFHTVTHCNLNDYLYKKKRTMQELLRNEIEAGLTKMNNDGIYPITFAYPYGAHNGVLDKELKRYFKSVRALNGTMDFTKSLVPTEKNDVLYGLGIDKSSKRKDTDIINMLNSAKNNNSCALLVAHDINTDDKFSVTKKRLLAIFEFVKANNLTYYTVSEISR